MARLIPRQANLLPVRVTSCIRCGSSMAPAPGHHAVPVIVNGKFSRPFRFSTAGQRARSEPTGLCELCLEGQRRLSPPPPGSRLYAGRGGSSKHGRRAIRRGLRRIGREWAQYEPVVARVAAQRADRERSAAVEARRKAQRA